MDSILLSLICITLFYKKYSYLFEDLFKLAFMIYQFGYSTRKIPMKAGSANVPLFYNYFFKFTSQPFILLLLFNGMTVFPRNDVIVGIDHPKS